LCGIRFLRINYHTQLITTPASANSKILKICSDFVYLKSSILEGKPFLSGMDLVHVTLERVLGAEMLAAEAAVVSARGEVQSLQVELGTGVVPEGRVADP
jgi:hypothetical protein